MADGTLTATIGADGTGTVRIVTGSKRRHWTVSQVSVELAAAPIGATCAVRKNGALVTPIIPTGDVAGGDPPVELDGNDVLTVTWSGCTPGQVGTVLWFYDERPV